MTTVAVAPRSPRPLIRLRAAPHHEPPFDDERANEPLPSAHQLALVWPASPGRADSMRAGAIEAHGSAAASQLGAAASTDTGAALRAERPGATAWTDPSTAAHAERPGTPAGIDPGTAVNTERPGTPAGTETGAATRAERPGATAWTDPSTAAHAERPGIPTGTDTDAATRGERQGATAWTDPGTAAHAERPSAPAGTKTGAAARAERAGAVVRAARWGGVAAGFAGPGFGARSGSAGPGSDGSTAETGRAGGGPSVTAGPGASGDGRLALRRFVHACVEVLNGYRPAAHLRRLALPTEAARVVAQAIAGAHRVAELRRGEQRPVPRARRRPAPVVVLRVLICDPRPGAVEASVILVTGERTWALALRLELHQDSWVATALRLI